MPKKPATQKKNPNNTRAATLTVNRLQSLLPQTPPKSSRAKPAPLPAITDSTPDDYRISLPNTEIGIHREAHVVFMVDLASRGLNELIELQKWYLDHGWFLDVVHVEAEPVKPDETEDFFPTKVEQVFEKTKVLRDPAGRVIAAGDGKLEIGD